MEYFKQLLHLLKTERDEDRKLYTQLIHSTSVQDRRADGLSWYPIAIRGSETGRGDYLTVEVERTTHHDISHQLRNGMPAVLFSNHQPASDRAEGIISFVNGNRLKLTLRTDELPEWANMGKLGVDLLFDENSYEEMESALKEADKLSRTPENNPLISVLTGERKPEFFDQVKPYHHHSLNPFQEEAVNKIVAAKDVAIIHGPPGTGKTTTLIQAIKALKINGARKMLVVAPSNTAVDLLTEKLAEEGLNVVRIGNPVRVSEQMLRHTLDYKIAEHDQSKEIKKLKKRAHEFKNMAHKYKRSFGKAERDQRKALFDEAHKIFREADNSEKYIIDDILEKAEIITATLVGSNHYTVRHMRYDVTIIDEAGQSLEPACWIPVLKASKVVLAGDHCQLPPTIKSQEAARNGLATTILEKCIANHPEAVTLLREQYRMHQSIMAYSSAFFYNNELIANESVADRRLFAGDDPLVFIDTAGCGYNEVPDGTSLTNPEEAGFLLSHLANFLTTLKTATQPTVAIIAPYKQQINLLKAQLLQNPELKPFLPYIAVNTVDGFQGQERDIVYLGMTRSNDEGEIGFLSDLRRMNVAMTRARKKLVVTGDSATLSGHVFYDGFIRYAESRNAWHSAWEFMES